METQIFVLILDNSDKHACLKEHHVRRNFIMIFRIRPKQNCRKKIMSLKKGS